MPSPIVKNLKTILDDRGYLQEILRADDPEYVQFGQVYISTTTPGTIKAFHRHLKKTDHIACIAGQVKLVVIDENGYDVVGCQTIGVPVVYEYHLSPLSPKLITIPPGLWHGWQASVASEAVLLSVTTAVHDPNNKDEERVAAIDNPFHYQWGVKHG